MIDDRTGRTTASSGAGTAWAMLAVVLAILGVLPQMSHVVALPAAAFAGGIAVGLLRAPQFPKAMIGLHTEKADPRENCGPGSAQVPLAVEIGSGLVPLAEQSAGAPLLNQVGEIRQKLSKELGFFVPLVQIKAAPLLGSNDYRITMGGEILAGGTIGPEALIALNDGYVASAIEGRACKDPAFGMDAVWIDEKSRSHAIAEGYIVLDGSAIIAVHLDDVVRRNAARLFNMDQAQELLEALNQASPELVDRLAPQSLSLHMITEICRALLADQVPLREFRKICAAMLDASGQHSQTPQMVDAIRQKIGDLIAGTIVPASMPLPVITLDPGLEALLLEKGQHSGEPIDPRLAEKLLAALDQFVRALPLEARNIALLTNPRTRRVLAALLKERFHGVTVIADTELPGNRSIAVVSNIGLSPPSRKLADTDSSQF